MNILFYSTHTLYAKALLPLIVKLVNKDFRITISKNRLDFLKYSPKRYARNPVSNTLVNRSSFDFIADITGYSDEWNDIRDRVRFNFFWSPNKYDIIIGTTKDMDKFNMLQRKYPKKIFIAIGYQHMPFILNLNGDFKYKNLPETCMDIFIKPNIFSETHRFSEYISDFKISFRGFSYLEKVYNGYYRKLSDEKDKPKKYVLIFHPGGYRGVITEPGEDKKMSYEKQKEFFITICSPILEEGLVPIIKAHPLAARYHFREDVEKILDDLAKDRKDFSKVIIEDKNYYKYVYKSDTVVTFGSSAVYELFSIGIKNILICNFLGRSRSEKFSFMKGVFIDTSEDYNNFWKKNRASYFSDIYRENVLLNKIYKSYSTLFSGDISRQILGDMGLL